MLGFKDGIRTAAQAELGTKLIDRLWPAARDPARESRNHSSHSGQGWLEPRQHGVGGENGRIGTGKKGKWREHMRGPGNSGDLGNDWGLINQLSSQHQIGASVGLDGGEQLPIALANGGK